ncbi:GPI-anchored protein [Salix suchowensis]|nr:GPI-anchored protein [Salix suchowensis]
MVSHKVSLFVFVLLQAIILLSTPVHCGRRSSSRSQQLQALLNLPALVKHTNAGCLADKIAGKLEDEPCTSARAASPVQIDNYPDLLSKCGIDVNHTNEGVALPVCVPHLVPTLLLTNYTRTPYARFINASRFSGAGLGHEDDWMVVVLTTSTPRGDFAGATSLVSRVGLGHCLVTLFLGALVYLLY